MAKQYQVRFDILGSLDPSLLAAIQNAQKNLRDLGKLNGKAIANAQKLSAAQSKLANLSQYKDLVRAVQAADKARAQELLTANKALAQQKAAQNQLDVMKASYKELQKIQTRLKADAQTQKNGVELARADLKAAKASGDLNAIKAAQAALQAQQESARRAAQEVKNINAAIKQGQAELKAQQNSVKELGNNFAQSSARAAQLQQQLAQQRAQLSQLRASAPSNLGQVESHLRAEIQATTAALNQEIAALERRNQIFSNFSQRQQDLANAYSNFQNALDTAQSIMTPFKDAADNAMNVEFEMSRVKALTQMRNLKEGDTARVESEMAELTAQVTKLGATTEFTRAEIAQAQGYFGMAGWDTEKILSALPAVVDLASITGDHNIPRTADVFSDLMTAMGLKPGQMMKVGNEMVEATSHFGDAMAYALTQSNMNRESFFEALKYSAPIAATAGLSAGEEIAANMIVANSGLKGSMAGTGMRSGLLTLAGANKKAQAALEEVGMTSSDAQKQMAEAEATFNQLGVTGKSFSQRVMQLGQAFSTMTGDEQLNYAYRIFGKNAATFWTKLLADPQSLIDFAKYADEIDNGYATGWAKDTAAVMRDNTRTEIEYVKSALDALQGAAGDALLPAIRGAAQTFAPLITSAAEFVAQNPALIQACAGLATALATATVAVAGFSLAMAGVRFAQAGWATAGLIFGDLAAKISAASTAMRGLTLANIGAGISGGLTAAANAARMFGAAMLTAARAALAFVFTPVGAILTAIALAAYYAYQNWDRVAPAISRVADIFNNILPAVDNAKNALSTFADAINFDALTNAVSTIADGFGSTLVGAIITAAGAIATALSTVINFALNVHTLLTDVAAQIVNIFSAIKEGDLSGIGDALKNAVSSIGDDLNKIGTDFVSNITNGLSATNAALETYLQPQTVSPVESVAPPPIDTSAAQMNVDALGSSAQNAAAQMQGVEMVGMNLTQAGDAAAQSATQFQTAGETAMTAGTNMQQAGDAALMSVGGFQAMVDGASAVAGALSAKAGEIAAIQINVPQVNYVPMNIGIPSGVAHNAAGGIYPRGEFLTTFAENSAEAAIPLDKSARAINLWTQAGQMLGVLPENKKTAQTPLSSFNLSTFNLPSEPARAEQPISITINVNISGKADEQTVRRGIEQSLPRVRSFAQELAAYRHEQARRSFL